MRNVHGEADHVVPVLGQAELQQIGRAARHLNLIDPARVLVERLAIVAVRGQRDRAGMRNRHRNGAQSDRLTHAELLGEQPDRVDESLPFQIRFEPGQQQERCALGVL